MKIASKSFRSRINTLCEIVHSPWIAFPPIPEDNRILFYKRDRADYGFLSNFFQTNVEIDGIIWPHTEAYYQAQKSEYPEYREKILQNLKPSWSKYVGDSRIGAQNIAKKTWFRKYLADLRPDWEEVKLSVMRKAVKAKYSMNTNLRRALFKTQNTLVIEDSMTDEFWGIGQQGSGKNWLGILLMDCRSELL